MEFGDYIVFADESGDHGLVQIDEGFPIFTLVFCVFEKERYVGEVEPAVRRFKYKYFGHDAVRLYDGKFHTHEAGEKAVQHQLDLLNIKHEEPFWGFVRGK